MAFQEFLKAGKMAGALIMDSQGSGITPWQGKRDSPLKRMQFEALKAKRELHLRKEKEKRRLAALKAAQPEESVTSPAGSTSAAQPPHPAQNVCYPS